MYVSVETIAVVISSASLLFALAAGFAWMIKRTDEQFAGLGERINSVESKLGDRISGVERELVEVKIAVARIEGPPRHLQPIR